jgi:hypothetical protein
MRPRFGFVRIGIQLSVWIIVPILIVFAFSVCKKGFVIPYNPHAPARGKHDPRTCLACQDARRCGGDLSPHAELGDEATVEYPEGHPLKGHEHLFDGK